MSDEPVQALSGELADGGHRYVARVYYADTDFSGVVYHARYLEFLERGRTDFLRLVGIHHTALAGGDDAVVWVVRRMEIDFRQPARMDDVIEVRTRIERVSGARVVMAQEIARDGEVLVGAIVEAATMSREGRPRRFPKDWLPLFAPAGS